MLTKLVSEEHINFMESVEDWKEAIRVAAKPLLDSNRITEKYIEAMIRGVEEFGPYVVIAPMIAMPHARPEFGSIKPGISVLKLKKPISFTSDDENLASVIIVISTKENEAHLEMISELAL
ncbi:MAG: PTS sugar transporter subunit IIA, partial [Thermoanaerobacteraceae bacterium]|nr:PTS sugar transporter subunit IIA [Thermoanaerobacteraceae bacterium]